MTVYRLHPLVPDLLDFRDWSAPNDIKREVPVASTVRAGATAAMHDGGLANWALTMGRQRLGALTLNNHPMFLQNLPMPRLGSKTGKLDIAALDIIRDRERGIPRFNEFRRQYGMQSLTGFDDFINISLPENSVERQRQQNYVNKLRQIYGQHKCDDSKPITASQNIDGKPITDCLGHPNGTMVDNVEDVDTVVGWLAHRSRDAASAEERAERASCLRYLGAGRGPDGRAGGGEIHWDFIRAVQMSVANVSIVPVQDVLGLDSSARMNTPGRANGNWAWRLEHGALTPEVCARLRETTAIYGRLRAER